MKKLLYSIGMVLALTACTDDYKDWASPLSNEEESAITISGFTASAVDAIDLNNLEADSAKTFNLATGVLPDGYTLQNVRVQYTPQDVEGAEDYEASLEADGMMSKAALQSLVESAYGKRPTARTFTGRVYANAVSNGQAVLIDAGSFNLTVTPEAPYISQNYYLIGAGVDWALDDTSRPFTHSDEDVYADPEFTITIPVTDGEYWFAIADDSTAITNDWNALLGCTDGNGLNGDEGQIARRSELGNEGSWKVTVSGDAKYLKITLNMMDYTYKIEKLNFGDYIYEIGNESGWATTHPLAGLNQDGKYTGFSYLNGQFKYKPNAGNDWSGDFEKASGDAYEGTLTESGTDNIDDIAEGFYMMEVDLVAMTYKHTLISSVSVVGDATANGWDQTNGQQMTFDATDGSWNISGVTLTDGTIKFVANNAWDINWGGDVNGLVAGGDNISVTAGTYDIKLIPTCDGKSTATLTKK